MNRPWLWIALAAHAALSLGYVFVTPVFESPDEVGHFQYAHTLLADGRLPRIQGTSEGSTRLESALAHHPPLYYLLLAGTQVALGARDVEVTTRRVEGADERPHESVLLWRHGWDEVAPASPEVRAFRALRGWSVLLGALALVLVHRLGRAVFPGRPAIADGAVVLLAGAPLWTFSHGVLDNGNLAACLCAAAFVGLAGGLAGGGFGLGRGAVLGAVIGCALLTKLTSLFLLPLAGAAWAWVWLRGPTERRATLASGLVALATIAAIAGWFYVRNRTLYGDWLASAAHRRAYADNALPPERVGWYLLHRLPRGVGRTLVGSFGWGGVEAPTAVFRLFQALAVVAVAGWIARGRRLAPERRGLALCLAAVALVVLGLIQFNTVFRQPQARYLLPGLGPLALLLAAGVVGAGDLLPAGPRRIAGALAGAGWLASSAAVLAWVVRPGLAFDPRASDPWYASLSADLSTVGERPPGLASVAPPDGAVLETAPVFAWRALDAVPDGARYTLHFLDPEGRLVAATYEHGGVATEGTELDFGPYASIFEPGSEYRWRVRRLPDRRAGETAADVEESAFATFRTP